MLRSGSRRSLLYKPPAIVAGSFSLGNFQQQSIDAAGTSPWTFTSLTFTAGWAIVGISNSQDATSMSVTINGVSATKVFNANGWVDIFYANVSAGTGNIVVTGGATSSSVHGSSMCMAMITNTTQSAPSAHLDAYTGSGQNGIPCSSGAITVPSGGVGIAFLCDLQDDVAVPVTWHGTDSGTSDASTSHAGAPGVGSCLAMSHKTNSNMTATGDFNASAATAYGMCIAWGP